jgi:hypothetical protein
VKVGAGVKFRTSSQCLGSRQLRSTGIKRGEIIKYIEGRVCAHRTRIYLCESERSTRESFRVKAHKLRAMGKVRQRKETTQNPNANEGSTTAQGDDPKSKCERRQHDPPTTHAQGAFTEKKMLPANVDWRLAGLSKRASSETSDDSDMQVM